MIKVSLDPDPYDPLDYYDPGAEITVSQQSGLADGSLSVYLVELYSAEREVLDGYSAVVAPAGLESHYRSAYDIPDDYVKGIALNMEA